MGLFDFLKKKPVPEPSPIQSSFSDEDIEFLSNGDIRLNPSAYCPLTLYNTSLDTASKIQGFFDFKNETAPKDSLRLLFMSQSVGIREVDALIRGEASCLSEGDVSTGSIFEHHAKDRALLYALCRKYTPELMDIYFQEIRYPDYVHNLEGDHRLRPVYERLVQNGLAVRGREIPLHLAVSSLSRDRLYAICKQFNMKGKRKSVDTAALLCEKPEASAFIESAINRGQCFMVKQTPETAAAAPLYRYASALAELFFFAYAAYFYRAQSIKRAEEAYKMKAVEGLQYKALDCKFSDCRERDGKVYTPAEAKALKFKLGCRCDLVPYNSRWDKL